VLSGVATSSFTLVIVSFKEATSAFAKAIPHCGRPFRGSLRIATGGQGEQQQPESGGREKVIRRSPPEPVSMSIRIMGNFRAAGTKKPPEKEVVEWSGEPI
jgi:hypothetical protein